VLALAAKGAIEGVFRIASAHLAHSFIRFLFGRKIGAKPPATNRFSSIQLKTQSSRRSCSKDNLTMLGATDQGLINRAPTAR
jgi:hypothetical protein